MGMLGGKCSECCGTKTKRCYAPKDTSGSCKRISDGTCSVESRCDCDTDGGDSYDPGGSCEDAWNRVCTVHQASHVDPGSALRQCGWNPLKPADYLQPDFGTTPVHWEEPYFLVEGESCDVCCSKSNPDGTHRLVGMDGLTARGDDNCYCCFEPFDGSGPKPASEFYVTVNPYTEAWWGGMSFRMKTTDENGVAAPCGNYTSDLLQMQGTEGDCTYSLFGGGCGDPVPPNFWARCALRTRRRGNNIGSVSISNWFDFIWTDYVPDHPYWEGYPCECAIFFENLSMPDGKGSFNSPGRELQGSHGIQQFLCDSDLETLHLKHHYMLGSTITLSKNPLP